MPIWSASTPLFSGVGKMLLANLASPGRYALVGAVGAAISNAIVILADQRGISYPLAMIGSFAVVVPACYILHSHFTFGERLSWARFSRFAGGACSAFPLSLAIMALLSSILRLPVVIASPTTTLLMFIWNYGLARWSIRHIHAEQPSESDHALEIS